MIETNDRPEETKELAQLFIEPDTHSFVVKIWLEETAGETKHPIWRGHVTHVATGQRRYLNNLSTLVEFIAPYLAHWHIRLPLWQRLCLWLKR